MRSYSNKVCNFRNRCNWMAYIPAILILEMGRLKWRIPISESCSAMSILNVHNPVIYHFFFIKSHQNSILSKRQEARLVGVQVNSKNNVLNVFVVGPVSSKVAIRLIIQMLFLKYTDCVFSILYMYRGEYFKFIFP